MDSLISALHRYGSSRTAAGRLHLTVAGRLHLTLAGLLHLTLAGLLRLTLAGLLGLTLAGLLGSTATAQTWPMGNGTRDVLHSYQNPFFFSSYFHEGVDLRGSLDDVVAVRSGIVRYRSQFDAGGNLLIEVQTPNGVESDSYLHVVLDPWNVGDAIQAGDRVGVVSNSYFSQSNQDHVHVNRFDGYAGGNGYITGRSNMLHPLEIFTDPADRDPQSNAPLPQDADEDGVTFEVVRSSSNVAALAYTYGSVDLLLEAADRQSSSLYWPQGLVGIGYWIESLAGGAGVRTAAEPYQLLRFDDAWRASQFDCDDLVTSVLFSTFNATVDFGPDNTTWTSLANYVLTNTRGTDGGGPSIDAGQSWRTDARLGTGVEPNGSDALVAREISEARFPDGRYLVHARTEDLTQQVDTTYPVTVDNFRPYVRRVRLLEAATGRVLYDAGWTPSIVAGAMLFDRTTAGGGSGQLTLEVEFSEPVAAAELTTEPSLPLGALASAQPEHQRTLWSTTFPSDAPVLVPTPQPPFTPSKFVGVPVWPERPDRVRLSLEAADLAGSTLFDFGDTQPQPVPFNKRAADVPLQAPTADRLHTLVFRPE